jgi:hypothetical protein
MAVAVVSSILFVSVLACTSDSAPEINPVMPTAVTAATSDSVGTAEFAEPRTNLLDASISVWELLGLTGLNPLPAEFQTDLAPLSPVASAAVSAEWFSNLVVVNAFDGQPLAQFCSDGTGQTFDSGLFDTGESIVFVWQVVPLPRAVWHAALLSVLLIGEETHRKFEFPFTLRSDSAIAEQNRYIYLSGSECSGSDLGVDQDQVRQAVNTIWGSQNAPGSRIDKHTTPISQNLQQKTIPEWLVNPDSTLEEQSLIDNWNDFLVGTRIEVFDGEVMHHIWNLCSESTGIVYDDHLLSLPKFQDSGTSSVGSRFNWEVRNSEVFVGTDVLFTNQLVDSENVLLADSSLYDPVNEESRLRLKFRDGEFFLDALRVVRQIRILDTSDETKC